MRQVFGIYGVGRITTTMTKPLSLIQLFIVAFVIYTGAAPQNTWAHCDTLSGPVIKDAKIALETKSVTPVLKWVRKENEKEIRKLFQETVTVRNSSREATDLVDMHFFETVVRIHRAGEGAPYTGLKDTEATDPEIEMADASLEKGSANNLVQHISKNIQNGIQSRFQRVIATKKHANDSVEAGRFYVEAYVDYLNFVESINTIATANARFDHSNEITHVEGNTKR